MVKSCNESKRIEESNSRKRKDKRSISKHDARIVHHNKLEDYNNNNNDP